MPANIKAGGTPRRLKNQVANLWVFFTLFGCRFFNLRLFSGAVLNRKFSKVCVENLGFCSQRWLWYWKYTSIWMAMLLFHTNSQHSLCLEENVGWDFLFCFFLFLVGWSFLKEWLFKSLFYKAWNDLQVGERGQQKELQQFFTFNFL